MVHYQVRSLLVLCVHSLIRLITDVYVSTFIIMYERVSMYVHVNVCMYIYVYIYIYICICICSHTYLHVCVVFCAELCM